MTLTDVTTTDWWKTMNVARADGTALVGYDALKQVVGRASGVRRQRPLHRRGQTSGCTA